MDDADIMKSIQSLVDEEHTLRSGGGGADRERLESVERMLDQCWDLLRQRRAKREFGEDPEGVHARDEGTVEGYQQ